MDKVFSFKQFDIADDRSAMKIGTDAVLLGAWSNVENADRVLDIGSGCGIIALMLAQRSNAFVDAVEIDKNAAEQSQENFDFSTWKSKMKIYNNSFQEFTNNNTSTYDLIVSNPPFFVDALKGKHSKRNLARHTDSLSFEALMQGISKLLASHGKACVILPIPESIHLKQCGDENGLFCNFQTEVIPKKGLAPNRILMEFSKVKSELKWNSLCILNEDLSYTDEFKDLTKEFYLNF
ncbi:MAG: methyltransferase [Bacteroidota bacterium]